MRQAPPVSVLCRGRGWRGLQAAVFALSAAAFVAWCIQHAGGSDTLAAACALTSGLLTGCVVWLSARRPAVTLAWDGERWTADGQPVAVQLMLDSAAGLLLQWRGSARHKRHCLGVSAREAGAAWHGLRTALYAGTTRAGAPAASATASPTDLAPVNQPPTERGDGWR